MKVSIEEIVEALSDFLRELDNSPFLNEVPDLRNSVINELSDSEAPLGIQSLVEEIDERLNFLYDNFQEEAEYWIGLLLESDFVTDVDEDSTDDIDRLKIVTVAGIFSIPRFIESVDDIDDDETENEIDDDEEE